MRLSAGRLRPRSLFFSIAVLSLITVVRADPIDDLPVGHWYEVPNSVLAAVTPKPEPLSVQGSESVITAASGGAYDTKRDRLIVWGGGARYYSGNEIYAFDVATLKWLRITEPSKDVGGYEKSGYYPDGMPRGRHTYDFIEYIPPPVDRFCSFGAATMWPGGVAHMGNVDCLDFDTLKWERRANALSYGIGATSAYDPVTGEVFVHGSGNTGFLVAYDAVKNKWRVLGRRGIEAGFTPYKITADIDPKRRLYVAAGLGKVFVWDLNKNKSGFVSRTEIETSGPSDAIIPKSPGFVYDPVIDKFVAWSGGANVFVLDIERRTWTKRPPAPTNRVIPTPAAVRGTFGRFRYIPSKNVYVVVNSIYENVYFYKLAPDPARK
jgi:hypothetical protein